MLGLFESKQAIVSTNFPTLVRMTQIFGLSLLTIYRLSYTHTHTQFFKTMKIIIGENETASHCFLSRMLEENSCSPIFKLLET